jgi:hypothetical protein
MVNLNDAVSLLRAKRRELLDQLDAVDKALAALSGLSVTLTPTPEGTPQEAAPETATSGVLPTRLKPARVLSDEHKYAMNEGRRKARHSKEVAAGRARELPEPSPAPAPAANAAGRRPRLVKQARE